MKKTKTSISIFFLAAIIVFPSGSALASSPKVPFLDMNNVRLIQVSKNALSFINPNGILKFDTLNQTWTLESKQTDYSKIKNENRYTASKPFTFPDWVPFYYRGVKNQFVLNQNNFWLTEIISEGSTYTNDAIIDNQNRVIYNIPYQNSQSLVVQDDNIWIGHLNGITQINRISRQRIDYELWPKYENISGWIKYENSFYISTSDGKLFSFTPASGEIKSLPFSHYSFDTLFPSLESKKYIKKARYYFTNPVIRGAFLTVGVIPTDLTNRVALGQSGIMTFDLNNLGNSGIVKYLPNNFGIKKLVKINNDIFLLGNRREYFEGGDIAETGGVAILNEIGRRFDLPECGNKPVVAIKTDVKNQISILQQGINLNTDEFTYFECSLILNEPNENRVVNKDFAKITYSVRVLERVEILKNDPKIKQYEFFQFKLTPHEIVELVKDWKVKPRLKVYYNRSLRIKDYHSPMIQEIDGLLYPVKRQKFLNLN